MLQESIDFEIHPKEKFYFVFKLIAALIGYALIFAFFKFAFSGTSQSLTLLPLAFYVVLILLYLFFRLGFLIGYLKGNGVLVTENQFPDIYKIVVEQSDLLGISYIPQVYILQSGGILNAFATQFWGSDFVVIYSDVLEEAYENNVETVRFIIGHEMGHIKRKHITKSLWLFPSFIIPFIGSAYSRACEYTSDNIGAALSPQGVRSGLLLLASGKKLWKRVNTEAFMDQEYNAGGFWFWFSEKMSSHPRLTKRINRFRNVEEMALEKELI